MRVNWSPFQGSEKESLPQSFSLGICDMTEISGDCVCPESNTMLIQRNPERCTHLVRVDLICAIAILRNINVLMNIVILLILRRLRGDAID